MRTLLTLLLITAVSLQAALGCCCRTLCAGETARDAGVHEERTCCCCDHHAPDKQQHPSTPCKCRVDGGFVVVPKTPLAKPDCPALFATPAPVETTGPHTAWADRAHASAEPFGRLPLYLAHHLLLI